jgi:hypothetical protein
MSQLTRLDYERILEKLGVAREELARLYTKKTMIPGLPILDKKDRERIEKILRETDPEA